MELRQMTKVHIVTDSNCHIPEALCQELDIHVVPLPYDWDGMTYLDGIDMSNREFYTRLRNSDSIPTTSGPTPGSFVELYEKLSADGDPILSVHVGNEFSSTLLSANSVKEMLPGATIVTLDSHSNALGLGFQILALARAAREGENFDSLLSLAEKAIEATGVVFAVEDIEYLHRGGRISFGKRIIGTALNLIPIMEVRKGPIQQLELTRSQKSVTPRLIEILEERLAGSKPKRVGVLHSDAEERAWELKKAVEERLNPDELIFMELNPILGIHVGPGALGLAYSAGV
jgi:DegV family protein with EDD domain